MVEKMGKTVTYRERGKKFEKSASFFEISASEENLDGLKPVQPEIDTTPAKFEAKTVLSDYEYPDIPHDHYDPDPDYRSDAEKYPAVAVEEEVEYVGTILVSSTGAMLLVWGLLMVVLMMCWGADWWQRLIRHHEHYVELADNWKEHVHQKEHEEEMEKVQEFYQIRSPPAPLTPLVLNPSGRALTGVGTPPRSLASYGSFQETSSGGSSTSGTTAGASKARSELKFV